MIAIATQENGSHDDNVYNIGGTGLCQIENSIWDNKELTAYNFNTGNYETITVDGERLGELEYNIKVACMILSFYMNYQKYNIMLGLQTYNMGPGNMEKVITMAANNEG